MSGGSGLAGQAGQAGATVEPTWSKAGEVPGGVLEELDSPEKHKLFSWEPCEWTDNPDCEQMVLTSLAPMESKGGVGLDVVDDGVQTRVGFVVSETNVTAIADEEGNVFRAFRFALGGTALFDLIRVRGDRFAIPIFSNGNFNTPHGLLGSVLNKEVTLFTPKWPSPELGAGAQGYALTSKRWGMWINQAAMASADAFVGNPIVPFSKNDFNQKVAIDGLTATKDHFVSVEAWSDNGKWKPRLVISDGLEEAKTLLPGGETTDDATPITADTHIAWLRGTGYQSVNQYDKSELWSSPLNDKGEALAPSKVLAMETSTISITPLGTKGGWGRVLMPVFPLASGQVRVVDLTKKHEPLLLQMAKNSYMSLAFGVTRTHAWFGLDKVPSRKVIRWKLPPGGSSPQP